MVHRRSEDDDVNLDDVSVLKETEMAVLVEIDGNQHWVPKSQIREESEVQGEEDEGTLIVSRWWAEKESLA